MANKFVKVDYDKFNSKTVTRTDPELSLGDAFYLIFRHISMPEGDNLVIDVETSHSDWFFLRNGNVILNINNVENITLTPHENYSKVTNTFGYTSCKESCWYAISQEQLKKICDADSVDIKITGDKSFYVFEGDKSQILIIYTYKTKDSFEHSRSKKVNFSIMQYAQLMYNACFDNEAYLNSLNEMERASERATQEMQKEVKEVKSSGGCIVTILMAIGLLLSLVI